MQVRDVMTEGCVTVPVTATLADCVTRMLMAGTGSVVVEDDVPRGIVTESDVLLAAHDTGESLADIPVQVVMSHPVQRIDPSATLCAAADRMRESGIKKLLVARDVETFGMVTITDLVWHYSDFRRESARLADEERARNNGHQ